LWLVYRQLRRRGQCGLHSVIGVDEISSGCQGLSLLRPGVVLHLLHPEILYRLDPTCVVNGMGRWLSCGKGPGLDRETGLLGARLLR
jgi:hypothetical protein